MAVALPSQIRKPHAAIRELIDYPARIDMPVEVRRRAQLILHALAREALQRRWTVTPVLSRMSRGRWTTRRTRTWPNENLLVIDVGAVPAPVRLHMSSGRSITFPQKTR